MDTTIIIIQILLFLGIIYGFWMLYRTNKVYPFRMKLLKKYGPIAFESFASYYEMMHSFKPLNEESWVPEEDRIDSEDSFAMREFGMEFKEYE